MEILQKIFCGLTVLLAIFSYFYYRYDMKKLREHREKTIKMFDDLYEEQKKRAIIKDHEVREAINQLRDIAIEFHAAQQLRDRIAHVVIPLVERLRK